MPDPKPRKADQQLAMAALEKQRRGEKATREELAALRRIESVKEEEQRQTIFGAVKKGEWSTWSGRQIKTINEQAERYGAPLVGATFSLPTFAKWFHDWLAEIAPILSTAAANGEGGESEALEAFRRARAKREELAYQRDLEQYVDIDKIREGLGLFSSILRKASEKIGRKFPEAQTILDEAIEEAIHVFESHFGDGDPRHTGAADDRHESATGE